jgi:Flp pilus assembly protein TadG
MKPLQQHRCPTRHPRGVAAVELGFLVIPLALLTFGIAEYGRAMVQYNTLAKAVRDATRHLSQQAAGDAAEIATAACLAVHGNPSCAGPPLVPALDVSMVQVCDASSCAGTHQNQPTGLGVINLVTVSIVGAPFQTVVPFVVPASFQSFGPIRVTMRQVL